MEGTIYRVSGPVVIAEGLEGKMYDVVNVGDEKLIGEIIQIHGDRYTIQVYEDTSGIKPGEIVKNTNLPLSVELGPGLLKSIYDGIQRPLPEIQKSTGDFIKRGAVVNPIDRNIKWEFKPSLKTGDDVNEGDVIGIVEETSLIKHKILIPIGLSGKIKSIKEGKYTVEESIATLEDGTEIKMLQKWSIRNPRPIKEKLSPDKPLTTGMRVIDSLFPITKGGTASIPGPFGAGKTVTQQSLAKWSDADIIVYVGCGERGNEMTEILVEFPELKDPKSGKPLMERTIIIANTSNMPVAAREASIYTGITIAEYFRDQGYDVALMADSTSRWAEAMREISSRLEEMPGEEGYPAYLSSRLSEFYERAGICNTLNNEKGSVTVIGAVSPAGGDFSEPVTQSTLRVTKAFWGLDAKLANKRHFPSVNWLISYSQYKDSLKDWYIKNVSEKWPETINNVNEILTEEERLQEIVQLIGSDALPEKEQITLEIAKLIREFFLQQNAFHDVDSYCDLKKSYRILKSIFSYQKNLSKALDAGVPIRDLLAIKSKNDISKSKFEKNYEEILDNVDKEIEKELNMVINNDA